MYQEQKAILHLLTWCLSEKQRRDTVLFNFEDAFDLDWDGVYCFLNEHAIVPLTSDLIRYIPADRSVLVKSWKESVYSNIYTYSRLNKQQEQILIKFQNANIPIAVIKGTSAAKYYPNPQLRTMGDIDFLVKPDDFERAVYCLREAGAIEITGLNESKRGRHRSFRLYDVSIELHRFFSLCGEKEQKKMLDGLLFDAISIDKTVLPDEENGLVLLSHLKQHLEEGIGLRQVIDWMMFTKLCLDDNRWYSSFQEKAKKCGLETLAVAVTKACQQYLGLTTENISWCKDADDVVCERFMQYVIDCGNFGKSRGDFQSGSITQMPTIKQPIQFFKYIQTHGERTWKTLQAHPGLRPFAWVYQSHRYIRMAHQNKVSPKKLKDIHDEVQRRNEMFVALGIK